MRSTLQAGGLVHGGCVSSGDSSLCGRPHKWVNPNERSRVSFGERQRPRTFAGEFLGRCDMRESAQCYGFVARRGIGSTASGRRWWAWWSRAHSGPGGCHKVMWLMRPWSSFCAGFGTTAGRSVAGAPDAAECCARHATCAGFVAPEQAAGSSCREPASCEPSPSPARGSRVFRSPLTLSAAFNSMALRPPCWVS